MTKPTFLRVGVPKNKVRPPTKILPPTSAGAAPTLDPLGWQQVDGGIGDLTIPYETGVAGDIIIICVWTQTGALSAPAGWTEVGLVTGSPEDMAVWAKVADGTESGSLDTDTFNSPTIAASNRIKGNGQTLTLNTEFNGTLSSQNPGAVTLADSSTYFVIASCYRIQSGTVGPSTFTYPTGYDDIFGVRVSSDNFVSLAQKQVSSSGTEDPSSMAIAPDSPGILAGGSHVFTASFGVDSADPTVAAYSHTHVEADVTDLDHWVEADHDALDHTGLTGVGASDHGALSGLSDDDHTIYLLADGSRALSGALSAGSNKITNVTDPTADQDAATKAYVDAAAGNELLVPDVVENPVARYSATAAKTIANTTTETTMFGTGEGTLTFPANFLSAGEVTEIRMRGQLSDTGTPNFTIKLKLGSTVLCSVGPTALTGVSGVEFMLDLMLTCRSAGASGSFIAGGLFDYDDGTEVSLSSGTAVSIDTTVAQTVDVTWTWGTADPADTITVQEAYVDSHDPNRVVNDGLGPLTNEDEDDFLYSDAL